MDHIPDINFLHTINTSIEDSTMCYSVYISTNSDKNLSNENTNLIYFEKNFAEGGTASQLQYKNKWFVGSKSGCSCTFRHLYNSKLGFNIPVDWFEESNEEIEATIAFIRIVRVLITAGDLVDCVDVWGDDGEVDFTNAILVDLKVITDEQFRFFENHYFQFYLSP